jgi:hypothetical protein
MKLGYLQRKGILNNVEMQGVEKRVDEQLDLVGGDDPDYKKPMEEMKKHYTEMELSDEITRFCAKTITLFAMLNAGFVHEKDREECKEILMAFDKIVSTPAFHEKPES